MHGKSVANSNVLPLVVVREVASSGVVLVTDHGFRVTKFVTKSPCVAEQCDVNIHSLTSRCHLPVGRGYSKELLSRKSSREVDEKGRDMGGLWITSRCSPQNWGGTERNHTVTCMVLKDTGNGRHTTSPLTR
ncbi:hypothetical protein TNCV_2600911 [Trichonephila clavipes]|nr:hypothetical protein TNCV_2600911 [Trichonephila clavipes]